MHLRPTTTADIPRCATIHDAAFEDNELSDFLAPDRAKYPLSWHHRTLMTERTKYYQPNAWNFVCVADAEDGFAREGEILGFVRWIHRASKEEAASEPWTRHLSVLDRAESWLCWAELKWENTLRRNPAVSWTNLDAFIGSIIKATGFADVRATTHWYLDSLAVAPEYQRRGVGQKMVNWGLERAEGETKERTAAGKAPVPATLIASGPGLHLYRSLGFKVVGWADDSYFDIPAVGGSNMVWDSTRYWIQDVEYDAPMRRGVVEAIFTTRDRETQSDSVLEGPSLPHVI